MRARGVIAAALVLGLVELAPAKGRAQSDEDRAGARAAATEGAKAMESGKYAEAVDLFTRAESLVHAPPHLLYIARAYAKLGKLVRAQETYLKVTRETLPPTAPRAFVEAHDAATEEIALLQNEIPTVKIDVVGTAKDVVVTMDGAEVPKALTGVVHPIDPGEHVFRATAKGQASDPVTKTIAARAEETVTLTLQPAPEQAGPEPISPPATTPKEPADEGAKSSGSSGLRTGAFIGWGVGAVGVVVGTVFLFKNRSARGDADALCPDGRCPASQKDKIESLDNDANSAATMAWVGYGVGVAGLAAGTVMFLLSNGDKKAPPTTGVHVRPTLGLGSVGLTGGF